MPGLARRVVNVGRQVGRPGPMGTCIPLNHTYHITANQSHLNQNPVQSLPRGPIRKIDQCMYEPSTFDRIPPAACESMGLLSPNKTKRERIGHAFPAAALYRYLFI